MLSSSAAPLARLVCACLCFALAAGICSDRSAECHHWKLDGQCESNEVYMHHACPLACGVCSDHNCSDLSEHCVSWKLQGECTHNRVFMLKTCPIACGVCTPECADLDMPNPDKNETMCALWSRQGACDKVGAHDKMYRRCPVSCGVCKPK